MTSSTNWSTTVAGLKAASRWCTRCSFAKRMPQALRMVQTPVERSVAGFGSNVIQPLEPFVAVPPHRRTAEKHDREPMGHGL